MKYIRVVTQFANSIWAIQQDKFLEIRDLLLFKASGGNYSEADIAARIGSKTKREAPSSGAIAVIPVYGIVSQRVSMMDEISGSGSASTERIAQDFRSALADPSVSAIVFDVDSPGGTVFGVAELANEIYKARGKKPIVSVANSLAASAAYWIASAAEEFNVTPSGEAGSIGVFSEHTDISKWLETEGIKPTLISAGEFKVEGNHYQPLTEEAATYMQGRVNDYYSMFVDAVARYRGVTQSKVKKDFGGGRVFGAEQAVASGMADKVATFDQVIRRLGGSTSGGRPNAATIMPHVAAMQPEGSEILDAQNHMETEIVSAFNMDIERNRLELLGS